MRRVFITGRGLITPAGMGASSHWRALNQASTFFRAEAEIPVGKLSAPVTELLQAKHRSHKSLRTADPATVLGLLAAEQAIAESTLPDPSSLAVIVGCSRGATSLFEQEHSRFVSGEGIALTTSPQTTPGAFAATIARHTGAQGPSFFVSAACSTGLHAIGTAFLLLRSGLAESAIAGASEHSVTPFTLEQLRVLGVCSKDTHSPYPCKPFHPARTGMVLSDGAAMVTLETQPRSQAFAEIVGYGASTEAASLTAVDENGHALARAIRSALTAAHLDPLQIDLIIGHGAGTPKGDAAELKAYESVFGLSPPPLTAHKWLTGHLLGASSAFSVAMASEYFRADLPFLPYFDPARREVAPDTVAKSLLSGRTHILVCALGFGGNAAAIILSSTKGED